MADPSYADAQAQADSSARATLQQLAATGTSGDAAYNQQISAGSQAQLAAQQRALVSAAFTGQGSTGADAAPYAGMIGQGYQPGLSNLGALKGAFDSATGIREQGANTYFKEASAAIPIIEARANERIGLARQRALESAVTKSKAAKAASTDTAGKYVSALGGETLAGAQLAQPSEYLATGGVGAANAIAALAQNGRTPSGSPNYATPTPNYQAAPTAAQITEAAQNPIVTQGTPLSPIQAATLVRKYEEGLPQNKAVAPVSHAVIQGAHDYEPAIKTATDMLQPPAAPKGSPQPKPASIGDAVNAVMQQYNISQYAAEVIVNDAIVRISKTGTLANATP